MYLKQTIFRTNIIIIISFALLNSCHKSISKNSFTYSSVEIKHILLDSTLNIRALEIEKNKIYAATNNGEIYSFETNNLDLINVKQYQSKIDSVFFPNFRSLSVVNQNIFALTIGNPALLFKNGRVVYRENNEKIFYDGSHYTISGAKYFGKIIDKLDWLNVDRLK